MFSYSFSTAVTSILVLDIVFTIFSTNLGVFFTQVYFILKLQVIVLVTSLIMTESM